MGMAGKHRLYFALVLLTAFPGGCVSNPEQPKEEVGSLDSLSRYVELGRQCAGSMILRREVSELVDADDTVVRKLMRRLIREFSKTGRISPELSAQINGNGKLLEYRVESSVSAKSGTLKFVDTVAFSKPLTDGNLIRRVTGATARDLGSGAWQREDSMSCSLVASRFPGEDLTVSSPGGDEDLEFASRAFTSAQLIQRSAGGAVTVARYVKPSEIMGEVIETSPVFTLERWLP